MKIYSKKEFYKRLAQIVIGLVVLALLTTLYPYDRGLKKLAFKELNFLKYKSELALSGSNAEAAGEARALPVLLYHGIVSDSDRFNITSERFKEHMFALKEAGYQTVNLKEAEAYLRGEGTLPDKSFLLTFDDGRKDSYYGADPILQALGFNAVMYVATASSFNPENNSPNDYYLNATEVEEMVKSGIWEIGSHAVQTTGGYVPLDATSSTTAEFLSHKMWLADQNRVETNEEYTARVRSELSEAKKILEERFSITVESFAFPFGDYGQISQESNPIAKATIAEAVKENYELAFRQTWPNDDQYSLNYPESDLFNLKRIESGTNWTGKELVAVVENAQPKDIPFSDDFDRNRGWKVNWGSGRIQNSSFVLRSRDGTDGEEVTTGAFSFLDGARLWKNYFYKVSADISPGSSAILLSRFNDSENNLSCVFNEKSVRIEEEVNGTTRTLSQVRNNVILPAGEVVLGMMVDGRTVRCYIGNRSLAYARIRSDKLSTGGVGLEVWNPSAGKAVLKINNVSVTSPQSLANRSLNLPIYSIVTPPVNSGGTTNSAPRPSTYVPQSQSGGTPPATALEPQSAETSSVIRSFINNVIVPRITPNSPTRNDEEILCDGRDCDTVDNDSGDNMDSPSSRRNPKKDNGRR